MAKYLGQTVVANIDSDRIDLDVSREIAEYMPDESGFSVILMKAAKETTDTQQFFWYDNEPQSWVTTVALAADDDDTSIVVADSSIFVAESVVKVMATDEVLFVTKVTPSTDTLTVVRGYAGSTAAAIPLNSNLMRLAVASKEGSGAPDTTSAQPSKFYNYTQIIKTPFEGSRNADKEALKAGTSERNRIRREKALEHRLDIERTMLFGKRGEVVAENRKTTNGLIEQISSNIYDVNGVLTEKVFTDFTEMGFQWGSSEKLLIGAPSVLSIINQFAADRIHTKSGEDTYGLRLRYIDTFHGRLYIVPSKIFAYDYEDMLVIADMKNIKYRPYTGADTKLQMNIQLPDVDGWKDQYLTECGLQVRLEKTHAIATGITG